MKDRRPRKLKKHLKKRFAKASAVRIVQCAITTAQFAMQVAMIRSMAHPINAMPTTGTEKTMNILEIARTQAMTIGKIMKSGPQNWREA